MNFIFKIKKETKILLLFWESATLFKTNWLKNQFSLQNLGIHYLDQNYEVLYFVCLNFGWKLTMNFQIIETEFRSIIDFYLSNDWIIYKYYTFMQILVGVSKITVVHIVNK